jgi:hypothetical protein
MSGDALEDVAQAGEWIDAQPLAGGDEAVEHRRGPAAVVAAEQRPV